MCLVSLQWAHTLEQVLLFSSLALLALPALAVSHLCVCALARVCVCVCVGEAHSAAPSVGTVCASWGSASMAIRGGGGRWQCLR